MSEPSQAVRELREAHAQLICGAPVAKVLDDKLNAVIAELEAWRKGCQANADALKEACRISDERRLDNLELKAQLATVTKERDEAQKACAEMREALNEIASGECLYSHPGGCECCLSGSGIKSIAEAALVETDFGKGYFNKCPKCGHENHTSD